jgi:hypothetical protein
MSKIVLQVKSQVNEVEEFTIYHCNIMAVPIDAECESVHLLSYEKKGRAKEALRSFMRLLSRDLEYIEDIELLFLSVDKHKMYACVKPHRRFEKTMSKDEVIRRVSMRVSSTLHTYWY